MSRFKYFATICVTGLLLFGGKIVLADSSPDDRHIVYEEKPNEIKFSFVPGRLMFFRNGNVEAMKAASKLVDDHIDVISQGHAWVSVKGFCGSYPTKAQNIRAAKNRTNQVKSWFITHNGMKEEYYRTVNSVHSYKGCKDVVAVMSIIYAKGYSPEEKEAARQARLDSIARLREDSIAKAEAARIEAERLEAQRTTDSISALQKTEPAVIVKEEPAVYKPTKWYLKTNMLYDAALMPSLEIEYRFNKHFSAAVEGNIAWWHNDGSHKYYQLATVFPEVRWWFSPQNNRKGHYLGLFGGGGWYDLEGGNTGYKGDGGLIGLGYGFMFPIGKYLAFEAGVGFGFMHTEYEKYIPVDNCYVYQCTRTKNYFGPVRLRFSLVWNIGRYVKGGNK